MFPTDYALPAPPFVRQLASSVYCYPVFLTALLGGISSFVLQMQNMSPREIKCFPQGHRVCPGL